MIYPPPQIDAVTVCIHYADIFRHTLSNARFFRKWVIVACEDDEQIRLINRPTNVELLLLSIADVSSLGGFNAAYNKAPYINRGLQRLRNPDWVALIDADILLPADFEQHLSKLRPKFLYGAKGRWICKSMVSFTRLAAQMKGWPSNDNDPIGEALGFLQLFQPGLLKNGYFTSRSQASCFHDDQILAQCYPESRRRLLPINCLHLGQTISNWAGRRITKVHLPDTKMTPRRRYEAVEHAGRLGQVITLTDAEITALNNAPLSTRFKQGLRASISKQKSGIKNGKEAEKCCTEACWATMTLFIEFPIITVSALIHLIHATAREQSHFEIMLAGAFLEHPVNTEVCMAVHFLTQELKVFSDGSWIAKIEVASLSWELITPGPGHVHRLLRRLRSATCFVSLLKRESPMEMSSALSGALTREAPQIYLLAPYSTQGLYLLLAAALGLKFVDCSRLRFHSNGRLPCMDKLAEWLSLRDFTKKLGRHSRKADNQRANFVEKFSKGSLILPINYLPCYLVRERDIAAFIDHLAGNVIVTHARAMVIAAGKGTDRKLQQALSDHALSGSLIYLPWEKPEQTLGDLFSNHTLELPAHFSHVIFIHPGSRFGLGASAPLPKRHHGAAWSAFTRRQWQCKGTEGRETWQQRPILGGAFTVLHRERLGGVRLDMTSSPFLVEQRDLHETYFSATDYGWRLER